MTNYLGTNTKENNLINCNFIIEIQIFALLDRIEIEVLMLKISNT